MLAPRTAICGLRELVANADGGYTHVVSILDEAAEDPVWPRRLGALPRLNLRFDDITVGSSNTAFGDHHVDDLTTFAGVVAQAAQASLLVHCTHGMSRSTACAAIVHASISPHLSGVAIFTEVLRVRDIAWPNLHMVEVADRRLGRGGDLVLGAKAIYRHQLGVHPEWAQRLSSVGRGREVLAAAEGPLIPL